MTFKYVPKMSKSDSINYWTKFYKAGISTLDHDDELNFDEYKIPAAMAVGGDLELDSFGTINKETEAQVSYTDPKSGETLTAIKSKENVVEIIT